MLVISFINITFVLRLLIMTLLSFNVSPPQCNAMLNNR